MSDFEIAGLKRRLDDLERRVASLDGSAPSEPAAPTVDPEISRLLASGNMIGAIKRYREMTGVGLAEAKAAVEALRGRI